MYTIGDVIFGSGGEPAGFYHTTVSRRSYVANPDLFAVTGLQPGEQNMGYYSNGFLGAGGNQTGLSLGSVLSGVATGLESIFHFPTATVPTARTPGIIDNQHPVLSGAGKASGTSAGTGIAVATGTAIAGGIGAVVAPGLLGLGGRHMARYAAPGTKGYHMIKKGPHAGMWTRNRHRNVANIRALRRALSRAHGFERICRKVMHFVSPHRSKGRPVFRRRRRKC